MGNTLDQYRAAIGLHYLKCRCTTRSLLYCLFHFLHFMNFLTRCLEVNITEPCTRLLSTIAHEALFINHIYQIIYILLILSGDVETNPGPSNLTQFTCSLDIFYLNIRSIRNKFDKFLSLVTEYDI
jgi:hypothetical protein